MPFEIKFTLIAHTQFEKLRTNKSLEKRFKAVKKSLRLLSQDPSYPGLKTHKYDSIKGPDGVEVFEAYAENKTPAAYRIFWCYHPPKDASSSVSTITILAITPHP